MARQAIKTISAMPEKFIPDSHKQDKDLSETAVDIINRPLVFYVRKMSRDERFKIQEMIELKDFDHPDKGVIGSGDVAKYIWENNITEVRNVVIKEGEEVKTYESLAGESKNQLWNTSGMDAEMAEAIMYARTISQLDDQEAKNSP